MHFFKTTEAEIAFSYPWSYNDHLQLLEKLRLSAICQGIYFYKENIINSLEGRRCDLLTITSFTGMTEEREERIPLLFPEQSVERAQKFVGKPIVIITARVHPGETPGSFVMNGFLYFIMSDDPRAISLRDNFVFKIIPMLNPDGVYRGYYRTDTRGINLNRFYTNPSLADHPTVFAVRELVMTYHRENKDQIYLYVDLHGHATKKGCFIYGNYLDFPRQIETCLFAKLMALNCVNFDFEGSNFTEKNMHAKDKRGLSKDGSGRVALFKSANLVRCYTLECNYNSGRLINQILPSGLEENPESLNDSEMYKNGPPVYTMPIFEDVGKAIGISLLDTAYLNNNSRVLPSDPGLKQLRVDVASFISTQIPFRFDPNIKKASKSQEDLENFIKNGCKPPKLDSRPKLKKITEETKPQKRYIRITESSAASSERLSKSKKSSLVESPKKEAAEIKPKQLSVVPVKNYTFPKPPKVDNQNILQLPRGRSKLRAIGQHKTSKSLSTKRGDSGYERNKSFEREPMLLTVMEAAGE
mmetsp:Transcript_7385/g.7244  ORF Transcript_7385/g.7244 Transcript_7385/m.7244 type:complete len:528 (+) Transcript_7385:376-1959(+)